jgi:hypothetical protein
MLVYADVGADMAKSPEMLHYSCTAEKRKHVHLGLVASGGNASRWFFVERDDVSLYRLGQEASRLFASLKSLQAGAAESATGARSSGRAAAFQSGL